MTALLVDIGNSRIKWRFDDLRSPPSAGGAEEPVSVDAVPHLSATWRANAAEPVATVFVSAVASPAVEDAVAEAAASAWPDACVERVVATAERAGVTNGYAVPSRLGPDRWLAMIGAQALFAGPPLVVCSFGTATTIDLLVPDGDGAAFVGGLILPGLDAMRRALVAATARLPPGAPIDHAVAGSADFALETDGAIAGGLVAAQVGAVERSLRAATRRLGGAVPACIVAGGAAETLTPALAAALDLRVALHVVSDLVLHGLAVVAREAPRGAP